MYIAREAENDWMHINKEKEAAVGTKTTTSHPPSANLAQKKTMVNLLALYSTGSPLRYLRLASEGAGLNRFLKKWRCRDNMIRKNPALKVPLKWMKMKING